MVTNLFTNDVSVHNYRRPVHCVALHPQFEAKQMFASGGLGQQFIINTTGLSPCSPLFHSLSLSLVWTIAVRFFGCRVTKTLRVVSQQGQRDSRWGRSHLRRSMASESYCVGQ